MTIPNVEVEELPPPPPPAPRAESAIALVLAAGTVAVATIFSRGGADVFRLPKELVFRAEAVVLLMLGAFWITGKRRTWRFGKRREFFLAAAIVCWTLITAAASTNRQLSADSLITVVAAAVIFIATCLAAQSLSLIAIDVLMIGCGINAVIVILQELKIWTPFPGAAGAGTHYGSIGLLGNANDVGTFLAAPAVAAVVLAVTAAGWRRWTYAAVGLLLAGGVAASATRTALIAVAVALIVFAIVHSRRAILAVAAILLVLGVVVLSPATTIGRGVRQLVTAAAHHDYEQLFSERLLPFLAAVDMTRDHPLLGVGPGCFKYHFMPYRVALAGKYPGDWTRGYPMNWGEVHNDHLQVASETGIPGYLLFLAAIALCVGGRRRMPAMTAEATYARALRWPLATVIFVICLAQFPLELAAPRLMFLSLGALCVTWDGADSYAVARSRGLAGMHSETSQPRDLATALIVLIRIIAVIGAALAIDQLCVEPFRGNLLLREIELRSARAQTMEPARAKELAHENLHDLDIGARGRRLDPEWYLLYGTNCEIVERWSDAADAYTRALQIDQRPEIYVNRGLVMLHMGAADAAVADLATAARFDPTIVEQLEGELRVRVAAAASRR